MIAKLGLAVALFIMVRTIVWFAVDTLRGKYRDYSGWGYLFPPRQSAPNDSKGAN